MTEGSQTVVNAIAAVGQRLRIRLHARLWLACAAWLILGTAGLAALLVDLVPTASGLRAPRCRYSMLQANAC